MFKKLFGKGREARASLAKLENRDLLQAIVYGCFYVSSADGELEPAELEKIERLLRNEPKLQGFGTVTFAYEHRDDRTGDLFKLHLNLHDAAGLGRREQSPERRLVLPGPQRSIEFQAAIDLGRDWRCDWHIRRR